MTGMPAATIARARATIGPPPSSFTPSAPVSLTNLTALRTASSSLTWKAPSGMSTRKKARCVPRRAALASITISSMLIGVVSA
jgi:hypothetical protein